MRKIVLLSLFFLLSIAAPAAADSLVSDIDIGGSPDNTDTNSTYWTGSDFNELGTLNGQLVNSNETTEEAWLEGLLGLAYNNLTVNLAADRVDPGEFGLGIDAKNYNADPGFDWDYAVVKPDGYWYAYEDTGNDDMLTTDTFKHGISHITFFTGQQGTPPPVPEPATMLLLGSGLAGLVGLGRKKFKK